MIYSERNNNASCLFDPRGGGQSCPSSTLISLRASYLIQFTYSTM